MQADRPTGSFYEIDADHPLEAHGTVWMKIIRAKGRAYKTLFGTAPGVRDDVVIFKDVDTVCCCVFQCGSPSVEPSGRTASFVSLTAKGIDSFSNTRRMSARFSDISSGVHVPKMSVPSLLRKTW